MGITEAILALIANAPTLINETKALYEALRGGLSTTDQNTIDQALATAIAADAAATARADAALDAAAKR